MTHKPPPGWLAACQSMLSFMREAAWSEEHAQLESNGLQMISAHLSVKLSSEGFGLLNR